MSVYKPQTKQMYETDVRLVFVLFIYFAITINEVGATNRSKPWRTANFQKYCSPEAKNFTFVKNNLVIFIAYYVHN